MKKRKKKGKGKQKEEKEDKEDKEQKEQKEQKEEKEEMKEEVERIKTTKPQPKQKTKLQNQTKPKLKPKTIPEIKPQNKHPNKKIDKHNLKIRIEINNKKPHPKKQIKNKNINNIKSPNNLISPNSPTVSELKKALENEIPLGNFHNPRNKSIQLMDIEVGTRKKEHTIHNAFKLEKGFRFEIKGKLEKKPIDMTKEEMKGTLARTESISTLPENLQQDIHNFSLEGFAQKHFQKVSKGYIFNRRTIPLDERMSYQKDPIETSLIKLPKASHCKTAIKIFKNLLVYMGDLNSKSVSEENAITSILKTGINTPELRDEIYVQVLKQLTNNPNGESEINGWCASCLLAHSFIPTRNLQTFVEDYFQKYSRNGKNKKIKKYARYSFRTLRATIRSNIFATPNPQLISTINIRPFERNIFGIPLEEVREIETKEGSNTRIPRILIYLYQNIEKYNGFQTQGIFRVPGNTNSVKELKQHLNRDPDFSNIDESDPMVFASTLKLFFRELDPPTIPYRYYQEFVNSDNWEQLESLINKFTDYNKLIFASLIHFFQKLTQPKYVKITKMNIDNISMVFAPNLLRKLDINSMIYSSEVPGKTQIGLIIKNWNVSSILN